MNQVNGKKNFVLCAAILSITGCGSSFNTTSTLSSTINNAPKRAVLLASHGDIDSPETELREYIETSFQKNVGIPLPGWSRGALTGPAYALSLKTVSEQYQKIGPTFYKRNSEIQKDAIQEVLNTQNPETKVYLGYNFTHPLIEQTLAQMQKDGVEEFVVVNKGAQFSYASSGENMEDTLDYLHKHPEWNVKAIGVRHYSDDNRFVLALKNGILRDINTNFPTQSPQDVCVLVASHGLPVWLIRKGDPAVRQMLATFESLKAEMPQYKLFHGFLNDDFFPGAQWVKPKALDLVESLQKENCSNILMDGRLSFTTHHRATLYDLNVEVRQKLESFNNALPQQHQVRVVLAPNFDGDMEFASFIAALSNEAFNGKGNLLLLKPKNGKPLAKGDVGTPGKFTLEL